MVTRTTQEHHSMVHSEVRLLNLTTNSTKVEDSTSIEGNLLYTRHLHSGKTRLSVIRLELVDQGRLVGRGPIPRVLTDPITIPPCRHSARLSAEALE